MRGLRHLPFGNELFVGLFGRFCFPFEAITTYVEGRVVFTVTFRGGMSNPVIANGGISKPRNVLAAKPDSLQPTA